MILDDGGDATLLLILGSRPRRTRPSSRSPRTRKRRRSMPRSASGSRRSRAGIRRASPQIRGVTEETTTGVKRLYQMADGRQAAVPRHQRQRLGHEVQVRQPLRLPRVARRRHQARDRRHDRRQDRARRRLRRRRQGLRAVAARPRRDRVDHRDRPDLRAAGGDGGLPGRDDGRGLRQGRHLRHRDRQRERDHPRPHAPHEAPGDRLQHRPLRQRDRHRLAAGSTAGRTSSRRSTT